MVIRVWSITSLKWILFHFYDFISVRNGEKLQQVTKSLSIWISFSVCNGLAPRMDYPSQIIRLSEPWLRWRIIIIGIRRRSSQLVIYYCGLLLWRNRLIHIHQVFSRVIFQVFYFYTGPVWFSGIVRSPDMPFVRRGGQRRMNIQCPWFEPWYRNWM